MEAGGQGHEAPMDTGQKMDNLIKQEGKGPLGDIADPPVHVGERTFSLYIWLMIS